MNSVARDAPASCPENPPCLTLLTDPAEALRDTTRWPRHLCPGVAEESIRRWARRQEAANPGCVADEVAGWKQHIGELAAKAPALQAAWDAAGRGRDEFRVMDFVPPHE